MSNDDAVRHGTTRPSRALLRAAVAPLACGFSLGVTYGNIGAVIEEPAFLERFHHPSDGTVQGLASIMQAGCVVGSLCASWCTDSWGRRPTILVAMAIVACSCVVLGLPTASLPTSLAALFGGRLLSGIGGGLACAAVPLHVSEVAHRE
jgi:MFS family permease